MCKINMSNISDQPTHHRGEYVHSKVLLCTIGRKIGVGLMFLQIIL